MTSLPRRSAGGVDLVQLRDKDGSDEAIVEAGLRFAASATSTTRCSS